MIAQDNKLARVSDVIKGGRAYADGFPPREPFIGRVVDMEVSGHTFDDGTYSETLWFNIEPLDRAVETTDGLLRLRWRLPKDVSKGSGITRSKPYNDFVTALDQAMAAVGLPTYTMDQVIGKVFIWGEKDKAEYNANQKDTRYHVKNHNPMPFGIPEQGWEQKIDRAALAQEKAEKMAVARQKQADSEAGQPRQIHAQTIGSNGNGTGHVNGLISDTIDLGGVEKELAAWHEGRTLDGIIKQYVEDTAFLDRLKALGLHQAAMQGKLYKTLIAGDHLVINEGVFQTIPF